MAGAEDATVAALAERFFKDIQSELMLAQWKDTHLDESEWHISVENADWQAYIVYLSTQAQALLKELKPLASNSVWVLPVRGTLAKSFANNALNQALKVSLQGQEIPAFTIHDLRRTASTLLQEQGWPWNVVEKALTIPSAAYAVSTTGGVRRAAAGDVAGLVGLHRQPGAAVQSGDASPSEALVPSPFREEPLPLDFHFPCLCLFLLWRHL